MSERWIVTGASGQLGGHVLRALERDASDKQVVAFTRGGAIASAARSVTVDLADASAVHAAACAHRPTHVVHVGAMTAVGDCHANPERARAINVAGTAALVRAADESGARLVFTSTDMVFDGAAAPYDEAAVPRPTSVYGGTKRDAESVVVRGARALVVRIPLLYGLPLTPRATTFASQLAALRGGRRLTLFTDEFRTPVHLADAAAALVALARSDLAGVIHVAGPERLSRYQLIERVAAGLGIGAAALEPVSRLSYAAAEPRPADLSLDGSRFRALFPALAPRPVDRAMREGDEC